MNCSDNTKQRNAATMGHDDTDRHKTRLVVDPTTRPPIHELASQPAASQPASEPASHQASQPANSQQSAASIHHPGWAVC